MTGGVHIGETDKRMNSNCTILVIFCFARSFSIWEMVLAPSSMDEIIYVISFLFPLVLVLSLFFYF